MKFLGSSLYVFPLINITYIFINATLEHDFKFSIRPYPYEYTQSLGVFP